MKHFVLFLLLLSVNNTVVADQASVQKLSQQLANTETISASFRQVIQDVKGLVLQEAIGSLVVKRPNKLHWLTQQPYEHLVVTDGDKLWLYDMDLEQINEQSYQHNIDKAPALLLSGNVEQITDNYEVNELQSEADILRFELTPKSAESAFVHLTISFQNQQIVAMSLLDNFDQITEISFSDITINQPVADQQFQFVPPEGVEIIRHDS